MYIRSEPAFVKPYASNTGQRIGSHSSAHHPFRNVALGEDHARRGVDGRQAPAEPHGAVVYRDGRVEHPKVGRGGAGVRTNCGVLVCGRLHGGNVRRTPQRKDGGDPGKAGG